MTPTTHVIIGLVLIGAAGTGLALDKKMEALFNRHSAFALLVEFAIFAAVLIGLVQIADGAAAL